MPTFNVVRKEITASELGGSYIFKRYFDNDGLFQELERCNDSDNFRFKIPEGKLPKVRQVLDNYFFNLETVDNITDYCIVQQKETDSSTIIRNAIASQRQGNHDIFL